MGRSRIPLRHGPTCICRSCSGIRRAAWREANRRRRLPAEDFTAELQRLRAEGATSRELAAASGLALGTVYRLLNEDVLVDPATQDVLAELKPARRRKRKTTA
jgi:DNA invertase Pin-like site-specific DNA recombinase